MTMTRSSLMVCAAIAAMAMAAACNTNEPTEAPAPPPSNLVSSASSPADGDATITKPGKVYPNYNGSGFDYLILQQDMGQTPSMVQGIGVMWDMNTHALHSVEHWWGDALIWTAYTTCGQTNVCDASKVAIDVAGHKITFAGLVLPDSHAGGTDTSTLDGTIRW